MMQTDAQRGLHLAVEPCRRVDVLDHVGVEPDLALGELDGLHFAEFHGIDAVLEIAEEACLFRLERVRRAVAPLNCTIDDVFELTEHAVEVQILHLWQRPRVNPVTNHSKCLVG